MAEQQHGSNMNEGPLARRAWVVPTSWSVRFGLMGLALWLALLCWAFASYPAMDNLAVSWIPFAFFGLPGVEMVSQSVTLFALVLLCETFAVASVFSLVGLALDFIKAHLSQKTRFGS